MMLRFVFVFIIFGLWMFNMSCTHLSQPPSVRPRIGLILGAGGARALSSIGVLKALQEYQIPIDYLIGMGWGAWIAGVYAKNQSINEVQWSFYKLSKRGFFDSSFFKASLQPKSIDLLEKDLEENFSLSSPVQVSFACPSLTRRGRLVWQTQKLLRLSVKKCLAVPPFFKLQSYNYGAVFSVEQAFRFLKEKKMDIIIWVHPVQDGRLFPKKLSSSADFFLWTSLRESLSHIAAELNIQQAAPKLQDFYLHDFSQIKSIIAAGEKEGRSLVKVLKKEYSQWNL